MNRTWTVMLAALWITASLRPGHASDKNKVLNAPADPSTAVRFYYQSTVGDYLHPPFIFRVVGEKDARLNTAPMTKQGRTIYLAAAEMQAMLQGLAHLHLSWKRSNGTEVFEPPGILDLSDKMTITAVSSNGTAKGSIAPAKICETLAALDSTLKTPRALWEFQEFRYEYDCKVPGLDRNAYPGHY